MIQTLLLDRDGTIIKDTGYVCTPETVELLPGAVEGLSIFRDAGVEFYIATNQSGIERGIHSEDDMHACNERMRELLAEYDVHIQHIAHCPHLPEKACTCRKPAVGMWESLRSLYPHINAQTTCMVGDKDSDVSFGKYIGCTTVCIDSGEYPSTVPADYTVKDLQELADILLS